jgi:hypothetical protein
MNTKYHSERSQAKIRMILTLLSSRKLTSAKLGEMLEMERDSINSYLRHLVDTNQICIAGKGFGPRGRRSAYLYACVNSNTQTELPLTHKSPSRRKARQPKKHQARSPWYTRFATWLGLSKTAVTA